MSDVCVVLEGTYPYVTGGVSEWVHGLVEGMPETSFSVAHLRYEDDPRGVPAYELPANVTEFVEIDMDPDEELAPDHERLPQAGIYHALSTGYAGLAAAEAAEERGAPFVVTEHGLMWREAPMGSPGCHKHRLPKHLRMRGSAREEARRKWAAHYEGLARDAYARADRIATVCDHNAAQQAGMGADPRRQRVIPNSVASGAPRDPAGGTLCEPHFGFVGRVVRIKDIATLLRAARVVSDELPRARFSLVGPLGHDPGYVAACRELASELGLEERIDWVGEADPSAWYPRLDALVLTSLSEAQPLVLLEAMTAGVPCVATDVGGCRDLLAGGAGLITPTGDPAATAAALARIAREPGLRRRMVREGYRRVAADHSPAGMLGAYRRLYEEIA